MLFIFLYQIVQEKENKLRMGMNLMGLKVTNGRYIKLLIKNVKSSMFWASWFTLAQVFNILMTLVLVCFLFIGYVTIITINILFIRCCLVLSFNFNIFSMQISLLIFSYFFYLDQQ